MSFLLVGFLPAILLVSARIYFARTGMEQAPGEPVLISITVAPKPLKASALCARVVVVLCIFALESECGSRLYFTLPAN